MPKINISKDQNTISVDGVKHTFKRYDQLNSSYLSNPCGKCSLKNYCVAGTEFTCWDSVRKDNKNGVFILKQK